MIWSFENPYHPGSWHTYNLFNNQINESINKIKAAHKYEEKNAFFYYYINIMQD